jgi:adenine-specific DNA-methyltransferase
MKKPVKKSSTPITSTRHSDKRANIPTEELRDFVAPDEKAPKTILYPRDPSLDPQLVWKGKDEQDCEPLAVPSVPVYIQEKIHPQAIIETVRRERNSGGGDGQLSLFADFNNIEFEDLVDFYHHEQNWSNRMILGDSLLVMTSLAEKEGLEGAGADDLPRPALWDQVRLELAGEHAQAGCEGREGRGYDATARAGEGVSGYVGVGDSFIFGVFKGPVSCCAGLLTESGSIFIQIGDENVHLVRTFR